MERRKESYDTDPRCRNCPYYRAAMRAIDDTCPLCGGKGYYTAIDPDTGTPASVNCPCEEGEE